MLRLFSFPDGDWLRKPANKCQAIQSNVQKKFKNIKKGMTKTPERISPVKKLVCGHVT